MKRREKPSIPLCEERETQTVSCLMERRTLVNIGWKFILCIERGSCPTLSEPLYLACMTGGTRLLLS